MTGTATVDILATDAPTCDEEHVKRYKRGNYFQCWNHRGVDEMYVAITCRRVDATKNRWKPDETHPTTVLFCCADSVVHTARVACRVHSYCIHCHYFFVPKHGSSQTLQHLPHARHVVFAHAIVGDRERVGHLERQAISRFYHLFFRCVRHGQTGEVQVFSFVVADCEEETPWRDTYDVDIG